MKTSHRRDAIDGAPVAPWEYNPSSWKQRVPICVLACLAFLIAVHLSLFQWRLIDAVWDPVFGSDRSGSVIDSQMARRMHTLLGIPDAALGALAYLGDAIFGLAGSNRRWRDRPWLVILFGLDVIPLGVVSAVLVLCQAFIIGEWCFLCLVTAVISLALVYLAYDEVFSSLRFLRLVWRQAGVRAFWLAFCGRPEPAAELAAREMLTPAA